MNTTKTLEEVIPTEVSPGGEKLLDQLVEGPDGTFEIYKKNGLARKVRHGLGNVMVGYGILTYATVAVPAMIITWPLRKLGKYVHDKYTPNKPLPEGYSDKLFTWK